MAVPAPRGFVPPRYREVSVVDVPLDVSLDEDAIRTLLMSRPAYRRSGFAVLRHGSRTAVVRLQRGPGTALFGPVLDVDVLAGPDETAYVRAPDADTAVPSELARVLAGARDRPGVRCLVVEGRYGHVNFILDPDPVRLRVLDVAPPEPAKLVDQVRRLLALAEDLPAMTVHPDVITLGSLLAGHGPVAQVLLQCRGGGMDVPGVPVSYLDEVPQRAEWTLLGCERSRQIHRYFYGGDAPTVETCPRVLCGRVSPRFGEVLLTKCCLLEDRVETGPLGADGAPGVVVPWGASLAQVREGLAAAAGIAAVGGPG